MIQCCKCAVQDLYSQNQPWDTSKQLPIKYCTNLSCLLQEEMVSVQKFSPASLHTSLPDLDTDNCKTLSKAHFRN